VFLEAFARAFPDGDERAVIVGSALFGEEDYATRLESHAAELGLDSRVEFRGFRDDVWQELARVDVLVHASTVPEPFGQVVLEGLAAGVPVIATREGGPGEILEHGRTGVLYPAGDVDALAAALRDVGADGDLRRELADRGRQRAQDFAPGRIAPAVRELYDQILERRGA
jgi:glycosyltransferase involved in cell wall biosynthesis